MPNNAPHNALRHHVSGAIERGEKVAIEAVEHGTPYEQFRSILTAEELASIPRGKWGNVDVHTVARALNAPSGSRPRIYAYIERGEFAGQIVSLKSLYDLERFDGLIGFAWTSENTIADIIRKA